MLKKKTTYNKISVTLLMVAILFCCGCSDDTSQDIQTSDHQVHFMLGSQQLKDVESSLSTRSLPSGYEDYQTLHPNAIDAQSNMVVFFTPSTENPARQDVATRRLYFNNYQWSTNVTILDESHPYYIYGFMPISADDTSSDVDISLLRGETNYSKGACLTINDMNAVTLSDVCVISGVKQATDNISFENVNIVPGAFSYQFSTAYNDYVCLLLDHICAGIDLQMKVDETYATLRSIKLKSLKIWALSDNNEKIETMTGTVNITANTQGVSPIIGTNAVTFTSKSNGNEKPITLYDNSELTSTDDDQLPKLTTMYQNLQGYYAPPSVNRFLMKSIYNIYDRKGNLIREDCAAENIFTIQGTNGILQPGKKYTVQITVTPTYLYVLSEPDLDNPTFTVTNQ